MYDKNLASRVRDILQNQEGLSEREMFGGIGFMLHGNMSCGVIAEDLIVRVGPDAYDQALKEDNVSVFDMTGRLMRGWVVVHARGIVTEQDLESWVDRGTSFARSLPIK